MPDVAVMIAGRAYRLACDEGEEARLANLANVLDRTIGRMRENFGEIGDQRLTIMAALSLADEAFETRNQIQALKAEIAELKTSLAEAQQAEVEMAQRMALSLADAAERIERVAGGLTTSQSDLPTDDRDGSE
jgi:cell division protein ZapA